MLSELFTVPVIPESSDRWWDAGRLHVIDPRPVLALVPDIRDDSQEFSQVSSILTGGCKLKPHQYNVLHLASGGIPGWFKIREHAQPRAVLLFEVQPAQLGINALFRVHEPNRFDNVVWIPVVSIQQLMNDKALKLQLWNNALKPVFENGKYGPIV